jgi:hypothetical protein
MVLERKEHSLGCSARVSSLSITHKHRVHNVPHHPCSQLCHISNPPKRHPHPSLRLFIAKASAYGNDGITSHLRPQGFVHASDSTDAAAALRKSRRELPFREIKGSILRIDPSRSEPWSVARTLSVRKCSVQRHDVSRDVGFGSLGPGHDASQ